MKRQQFAHLVDCVNIAAYAHISVYEIPHYVGDIIKSLPLLTITVYNFLGIYNSFQKSMGMCFYNHFRIMISGGILSFKYDSMELNRLIAKKTRDQLGPGQPFRPSLGLITRT